MLTFFDISIKNKITSVLAVALAVYIIYATFYGAPVVMMAHRAIFTAVMLVMYFTALKPLGDSLVAKAIDSLLILLAIVTNGYIAIFYVRILGAAGGAYMEGWELALGFLLILVCLEASRRASLPFFIICSISVLYTFFGPYLPGVLYHPGIAFHRIVYLIAFTSEGIFGVGISIGASLMFMFMLFGSTMEVTGVGEFFMKFANSIVGGLRGGSGKAALVSSSLIGSIMGNATANVVVTGTFTIPLMIKSGFKRRVAAAIECYASEGGQYLPPVMGAAAFIMAQITRIPYTEIVVAAFIPAIMYYAIGFLFVDVEAAKTGLKGIPKDQRISTISLLKEQGHWLLPIVIVVYTIVILRMTPVYAAMLGVLSTLVVTQFTPPFKGIREIAVTVVKSLDAGTRSVGDLMGLLVGIGLVQQAFVVTGLGGRISSILIGAAGGNIFFMLFIGFVAALILGMGMPTPVAYLLVALFIAPGMVDIGVPLLAAHMFLFYIAVKSASTPPVGTAAMIASTMAKTDWWGTAVKSVVMSIPAFVLAFAFVYHPELLLLEGDYLSIALRILLTMIGLLGFVFAIQGYTLFARLHIVERLFLLAAGVFVITNITILIVIGILAMILLSLRTPIYSIYNSRKINAGADTN